MNKFILDVTCGGKTMWFDGFEDFVIFADKRKVQHQLNYKKNKQLINILPDVVLDSKRLPFKDNHFKLVVFDPPHRTFSEKSIMAKKYGVLEKNFQKFLQESVDECFRVLEKNGILIFKWAESSIKVKNVLEAINKKPMFGHKTSKNTIWLLFMKLEKV